MVYKQVTTNLKCSNVSEALSNKRRSICGKRISSKSGNNLEDLHQTFGYSDKGITTMAHVERGQASFGRGDVECSKRITSMAQVEQQEQASFDRDDTKCSNGDESFITRNYVEQRGQVSFRRGDKNRISFSEIRKHKRAMKVKYEKDYDNLLYFCFYKSITAKYYQSLQQR